MDLQLDERVVLVVGGTGLVGSAIAGRAREEGATVVVASRHGGEGIVMDARNDESVTAGVAQVVKEYGRLDALVVAAAPSALTLNPALNSDPAQVAEGVDSKALSFLRVANAVIPVMRAAGFGRIVGISGQNALITGNITGSIRNAALIIASKNLADELAGTGVALNTVNPGTVSDTPATEVEQGRPGQSSPAQIADLVTFLISPISAVSGESIAIGHRLRGVINF
ncbi:MAG TPA: SDR family oxidoreductase [Galbitalea sp.]|jgi:NAD(P)-dependent dehydrogenase (short-subunit alcohol dehydrogenase family)|nr:SDR family oxidoreductase [Galbitalea sp.]